MFRKLLKQVWNRARASRKPSVRRPIIRRAWLGCEMLERREVPAVLGAPPLAVADSYGLIHDHSLSVASPGVLGNDSSPGGKALSAVLQADVQHGTLGLNSNGSFTYTPAAGYVGSDGFSYKAFNGSAYSDLVEVGLTVA